MSYWLGTVSGKKIDLAAVDEHDNARLPTSWTT